MTPPVRSTYARMLERRKTHNAQVVFFHKTISEAENMDPHEAELKKEKLTKWSEDFNTNLENIENHEEYEFNEEYLVENCRHEELLLKALAILRSVLAPKEAEMSFGDLSGMSMANIIKPELKLSNIDVPTFSGNFAD